MSNCPTCGAQIQASEKPVKYCGRPCYMKRGYGLKKHPFWNVWKNMVSRCTNPNDAAFAGYGGRGIAVCDRWLDPRNFIADMGDRPSGFSIERLDNSDGYRPGNCVWASRHQQNNNKRGNIRFEIDGETKSLGQWAAHFGIRPRLAYERIALRGWEPKLALTTRKLGSGERRA